MRFLTRVHARHLAAGRDRPRQAVSRRECNPASFEPFLGKGA
jgi:hypothetical protein